MQLFSRDQRAVIAYYPPRIPGASVFIGKQDLNIPLPRRKADFPPAPQGMVGSINCCRETVKVENSQQGRAEAFVEQAASNVSAPVGSHSMVAGLGAQVKVAETLLSLGGIQAIVVGTQIKKA